MSIIERDGCDICGDDAMFTCDGTRNGRDCNRELCEDCTTDHWDQCQDCLDAKMAGNGNRYELCGFHDRIDGTEETYCLDCDRVERAKADVVCDSCKVRHWHDTSCLGEECDIEHLPHCETLHPRLEIEPDLPGQVLLEMEA